MRKAGILFVFALWGFSLIAAEADKSNKVYITRLVNPRPPKIDGKLDDPAWASVEWASGFTQREPDDGAEPTFQTAFKILYDEHNLYVGIRAYDDEPEKVERRVTRRDHFDGDMVEINIDSYHDHRTAFSFTLSAAGVKGDEAISDDGENWDSNWDPVWFGEASVDELGWTAEMKIPFSQLRFANKKEHVWGLQVMRYIFRKEERSNWKYIPQNAGGWVSFFGELQGIEGIRTSRRIELLPYTVSNLRRFEKVRGNPFATGQNTEISGGLDAKVGLTSDLTLDVTINPDFGQVEADPSEVNLTAFETFFEEKRPFFIEGQNILDYRLMLGGGGFSNDRLFYSRRIGRAPHHYPDLAEGENVDMPENASIAGAAKLTGKTHSGFSIGILDAITTHETAEIDHTGTRRRESVEPLTNYFVGRLQKDYNEGNTSIGGIVTAVNRNLTDDHLNFLPRAAYTGGFDFRHQFKDKMYYLDFRTAFSHVRGDREAIDNLQTSSRRYYQRPDADYLRYDPNRTSLSGHGGFLSFGRSKSSVRFSLGGMWRSPGLELNDLGFLRQADRIMQWAWVGYRVTNPAGIFRRINVNFNQWAGWDFGGSLNFAGGNINGGGQLKNYWWFWMGLGREGSNLSNSFLRGGPAMKLPGQWNQWYNISSDERKFYQVGFGGFNGWQDDGNSRNHNFRVWLNYRPSDAASLSIQPFYDLRKSNLQYLSTIELEDGENRYLFGRINQKTFGVVLRLNYSVTPDLSIQYYGQPFISTGQYSHLKKITQARAAAYADRFHTFTQSEIARSSEGGYTITDGAHRYGIDNPDFNFKEFRSNLVIRWEYLPGSTLYLVWAQNRSHYAPGGRVAFNDALRDLYDIYPENIFLIKVNRWFSL